MKVNNMMNKHTNIFIFASQHPQKTIIQPSSAEQSCSTMSTSLQDLTSSNTSNIIDISQSCHEIPVQPIMKFPKNASKRSFTINVYEAHDWVEYSIQKDAVFCFCCRHFAKVTAFKGETTGARAFIDVGFTKWKDWSNLLLQHCKSKRHLYSSMEWLTFKNMREGKIISIANVISSTRSSEVVENREHVKLLFKVSSFLGRQGLAFRGHDESSNSNNRGHFLELIETFTESNESLKDKIKRRYGHYTSPVYQNDIIEIFGIQIQRKIVAEVKTAKYFSIMADETKDMSKKEQLALLLRYYHDGQIKERAIGTFHAINLDAHSLTNMIMSTITALGLSIDNCVGQCFDGANVMSGELSGVQKRIKEHNPQVVYLHCHAHRLNLVLVHTIQNLPLLNDFFDTVKMVYSFISVSNTRHSLFIASQKELHQKVLELERNVPTRWLYWFKSIQKIILRFESVLAVLLITINSNDKAHLEAENLKNRIEKPSFIFCLHMLHDLLSVTNSLSEQLQSKDIIICSTNALIKTTFLMLKQCRDDTKFKIIFNKSRDFAELCGIRFDETTPEGKSSSRVTKVAQKLKGSLIMSTLGQRIILPLKFDENMRKIYFEVVDKFLSEYEKRFQDNTELMDILETFDRDSETFLSEDSMIQLFKLYSTHVDEIVLISQLSVAREYLKANKSKSIIDMVQSLEKMPIAFSQIIQLMYIVLTLPVTTASNERFFSTLKRVKSYLRTTMGDERLSHLMLMAVEPEMVKTFNMEDLVNEFALKRQRRYPLE